VSDPIKRDFRYDHTEDKAVVRSVQDVQPLLDMNKKEINGDSMYGTEGGPLGMRKVASIPLIVIEKWRTELGIDVMNKDHMPKVKQLLNDPEYAYLRTHNSRI
jgi:hypothetical protein